MKFTRKAPTARKTTGKFKPAGTKARTATTTARASKPKVSKSPARTATRKTATSARKTATSRKAPPAKRTTAKANRSAPKTRTAARRNSAVRGANNDPRATAAWDNIKKMDIYEDVATCKGIALDCGLDPKTVYGWTQVPAGHVPTVAEIVGWSEKKVRPDL